MKIEKLKYNSSIQVLSVEPEDGSEVFKLPLYVKSGKRSVLPEIMHVIPQNLEVESARLSLDSFDEKSNKSYYYSIEASNIIELAEKTMEWTYNPNSAKHELYGTIDLDDGSFMIREGKDGREWWEHRFIPDVP